MSLTFNVPTPSLRFQGAPFDNLLEIVSITYISDFTQYLMYTKVHSGGAMCQTLRQEDRSKKMEVTIGKQEQQREY